LQFLLPPAGTPSPTDPSALLAAQDWDRHPLGPPDRWPPALRSLMRSVLRSPSPMCISWGAEAFQLYNAAYAQVLCDKHPAAWARPAREVWAELGPQLDAMLARVHAGEGLHGEDAPFCLRRHGRDEIAYFSYTWTPVFDEDGRVPGFWTSAFETTQTVLARRAQADATAQLLQLFEQAPGFVAVLEGPAHVYRHANAAYLDFVGQPSIVGRPVAEVVPEAIAQGWGRVLDDVYRTGEPFVARAAGVQVRRAGDGALQELLVNFILQPVRAADGAVTGILIQGYDVSAEVHTQSALRESEAKFRAICDAIPQMVWSAGPDGQVDYYNRQWALRTGLSEQASIGDGWAQVVHPDDRERAGQAWASSVAGGEPYEIEYRLRQADGSWRWTLGRALPVRGEDGTVLRWMGTCTEIDDQVRTREQAREDDRRKDEFLAMLAHELRNPMAPLRAGLEILNLRRVATAEERHVTAMMQRQLAHMVRLVDELLDVARIGQGKLVLQRTALPLRTVVEHALEACRPLVAARGHRLDIPEVPAHWQVHGDLTRLVQVLGNLLANAAKYTPQGGHIRLEVQADGDGLALTVADDGIGIAPAMLERVFERFVQAGEPGAHGQGGLGIGLNVVRSLVEMHGGRVHAHSDGPGTGTQVRVWLPRLADAAPARPAVPVATAAPAAARRVLVVDDNTDAAETLAALIGLGGHATRVATDGAQALEAMREFAPEVVFLDIGMPGMDGYEVAARLRALAGGERLLLVALTGWGAPADRQRTRAGGFDLHVTKPIEPSAVDGILRVLRPHRPAPALG
jgi:PAS domain S-box-containing protein